MKSHRIPDMSPEARAFFASILGEARTEIDPRQLSCEQVEQLMIVLEAEAARLAGLDDPAAAVLRREVGDLASELGRSR